MIIALRLIYLLSIRLYVAAIAIASLFNSKAKKWISGRKYVMRDLDEWRKAHPGYWRKKIPAPAESPAPGGALQEIFEETPDEIPEAIPELSIPEVVDKEVIGKSEPPGPPGTLQEISLLQFVLQPALLVGLIALMTGAALQEDIAQSARSLLDRGEDILRMVPRSPPLPPHENQTHSVPATTAARAAPVQLDRSASGP